MTNSFTSSSDNVLHDIAVVCCRDVVTKTLTRCAAILQGLQISKAERKRRRTGLCTLLPEYWDICPNSTSQEEHLKALEEIFRLADEDNGGDLDMDEVQSSHHHHVHTYHATTLTATTLPW